ncbi:MAG: SGNH/GDSL hydrolase family protein [Candidatus Melainabacteria bacterium]|nr:SGNH/GDSL hydrolase family protein [Candidatus Melainabacteria bacterium]
MQTIARTEKTQASPKVGEVKVRKPLWRTGGETLLASLVAICLLETFFNFAGIGQQEFFEPDQDLGARHIPSKQVTWRMEGLSRDSFNSFGMRDYERSLAKSPGTTRIAVLGDSAAEGLQVPLEDTFPIALQNMLNKEAKEQGATKRFEVLNFGCAGYSSAQEVVQYETQVAKFSPDIVVLFYNQKDAAESVIDNSMRAISDPKPYCYLSPAGELKFDNAIMEARADELKPDPLLSWLRRESRLYGVINQTLFSLSVNDKRFVKMKHWLTRQKQNRKIAPAAYPPQNPDLVGAKLIERLNADVTSSGGRLIVMMFPNTAGYPDLKRQQVLFSKLAQKAGFGYLDLSEPFINHKHKQELIIEYHFSKKGHKFLADLLKPYIH